MGLLDEKERLIKSTAILGEFLDASETAFSELHATNESFQYNLQQLSNGSSKALDFFEYLESKLTAEDKAKLLVVANDLTKGHVGLLKALKDNKETEKSFSDKVAVLSGKIIEFTKG